MIPPRLCQKLKKMNIRFQPDSVLAGCEAICHSKERTGWPALILHREIDIGSRSHPFSISFLWPFPRGLLYLIWQDSYTMDAFRHASMPIIISDHPLKPATARSTESQISRGALL
jgi:hypothetical protein